jgi:hypothetical protein
MTLILGDIADLPFKDYSGFDLPQTATLVLLLSDGTSDRNQVLQQGAQPFPQAAISGYVEDYATILQLREYHRTKEELAFEDNTLLEFRTVRVFECTAPQIWPGAWQYSIILIDVGT